MDRLEYSVDQDGILTSVSVGWDAFARANGGRDRVLAAEVLGQPLLHFITGETLKHLWANVMDRVASSGRSVRLPYRCDAPGLVRRMEVLIEPLAEGGLRLVSTVLDTEEQPYARVLDGAVTTHDRDNMLWICSWCKRLRVEDRWIEVEQAAREFGLFEASEIPMITHGLCPGCEHEIVAELERATSPGERSAARVDRGGLDLV
jgi:hypothetical protein